MGVIGLGMGKSHLAHFAGCENAEISAICDSNRQTLAEVREKFNVPLAFTDYEKMLEMEEIDAVAIATPNRFHAPMTIEALKKGKHVLCEKPMAMNEKEARGMVRQAEKSKKKLMVHFNQRFGYGAKYVKDCLDSGKLGGVYYLKTGWLRQMGVPLRQSFTDKSVSGGGPLIDLGVHRLDFVLWLLNYPRAVSVSAAIFDKIAGHKIRKREMVYDVEDLGVAMIRFDTGAVLFLEASWATMIKYKEEMYTMIFGTEGSFEQRTIDSKVVEFKLINALQDKIVVTTPRIRRKMVTAQQHFIDCILRDKEPEVSGLHGVEIMKILDAIYKSSKLGREVKIGRRE